MNMQERLLEWSEISELLKELKTKEAALRRELCSDIINHAGMVNGRVKVQQNYPDFRAAAGQALSYKVDDKALQVIWENLNEAEKLAIKYKPSLSLAIYKKLPSDSILHDAVTTSLAMPTLKVEFNEHD